VAALVNNNGSLNVHFCVFHMQQLRLMQLFVSSVWIVFTVLVATKNVTSFGTVNVGNVTCIKCFWCRDCTVFILWKCTLVRFHL